MKTLLTLLAALMLAGCELVDTTSKPQNKTQKVYIYNTPRPYPWGQNAQDFENVRCDITIENVGSYSIYLTDRPSCGEFSTQYLILDLEPGKYTGTLQHWCGYDGDYDLTRGQFEFKFTVSTHGDCQILDSGRWHRW